MYCNTRVTNEKIFDNVTDLNLYPKGITKHSYERFSNVASLALEDYNRY